MYEFIDRHPSALGNSGRFLLWAMRGWVGAAACGRCPPLSLYRGFTKLGAVAALTEFHLSMTLLYRDTQQLTLAPMRCRRIAEDEALLLALWHGVAREGSDLVAGTLKCMVKRENVLPIARAMTTCCTQLALAGFDLTATHAAKIED